MAVIICWALSTFAPDIFARRDAAWAAGDPAFYELNDWLQYLGFLTFRPPVPAYKHSAAMFLKLRGFIDCDRTHPQSPERPESDREILRTSLTNTLPHERAVQADAGPVVKDGSSVSRICCFFGVKIPCEDEGAYENSTMGQSLDSHR